MSGTGGPAFPVHPDNLAQMAFPDTGLGMTKWEWFAGLAMVGILAGADTSGLTAADFADLAATQADEMLARCPTQ